MTAEPQLERRRLAKTAYAAVERAVLTGALVRASSCQLCGADGQIFAHHWKGYQYPLEVWWVCVSCNSILTVHDGTQTIEQAREEVAAKRPASSGAGKGKHKTDNSNLAAKLALRRHFLEKYHHAEDGHRADVLDCCQGEGVIWARLREEFPVTSYWGVDTKPAKGRLKIDSVRILEQPGWTQNVVDVDTYGSPWRHWVAILKRLSRPTTVFLTAGRSTIDHDARRGMRLSAVEADALGMGKFREKVPAVFGLALANLAADFLLPKAGQDGKRLVEALEAFSGNNSRYLGLRLEPA